MRTPVAAILLLATAAFEAAETGVPAIALEKGVAVNGGDFVVGYRFTLATPRTITELGVTDQNGDGKLNGTEPVKVAVWDTNGKELTVAEVPLTATAERGVFYTRMTPLKLEPGTYVIGALAQRGGEQFFFDSPAKALPGVQWEEGRFERSAKLVLPRQSRPQPSGYFGPVFKVLAAAEETASLSAPLRVLEPAERAVFQRDDRGMAEVPVCCRLADGKDKSVEVRAVDRQTQRPVKDWVGLTAGADAGEFRARLALPAGWYRIEFRGSHAGKVFATGAVERVGVGEVFVTCGQSNSANHGRPPQRPQDDRVSSCDFQTGAWAHGDDPQPGASGKGGSPWPLLGDLLVKKLDMPVGFICVGVGSTTVSFWTPKGKGYPRVKAALQRAGTRGVRAVLWHQGESDSLAGTSAEKYAQLLGEAIAQSRQDAHWPVPWGVALASFHPGAQATAERQTAVVAGQKKVIAGVPGVFAGPETDSYHTRGWLCDGVHFNAEGLAAHAQGWADALATLLREPAAAGK